MNINRRDVGIALFSGFALYLFHSYMPVYVGMEQIVLILLLIGLLIGYAWGHSIRRKTSRKRLYFRAFLATFVLLLATGAFLLYRFSAPNSGAFWLVTQGFLALAFAMLLHMGMILVGAQIGPQGDD